MPKTTPKAEPVSTDEKIKTSVYLDKADWEILQAEFSRRKMAREPSSLGEIVAEALRAMFGGKKK